MPNSYCTIAEIKEVLPDATWGTTYDVILTKLALRASRAVDRFTKRSPGSFCPEEVTKYFSSDGSIEVFVDELAAAPSSVSIAEDGDITDLTVLSADDYYLYPRNALVEGIPYNFLYLDTLNGDYAAFPHYRDSIVIVGKFGFSATVPEDVKQVVIIQAVRWFKRGQQGFQDTGAIMEIGQMTYTKALDPDLAITLEYLTRITI